MELGRHLGARELEILTAVGYLVMKSNYAEYCARQILRSYIKPSSFADQEHLKLSSRTARWIEDELRDAALPLWQNPGRPFLERLIEAYSRARQHRNKIVHGVWATSDAGGPKGATALLVNHMPIKGKEPVPEFISIDHLRLLGDHFTLLAAFSQRVMVAFDQDGAQARNSDGTPVVATFPELIPVLPACEYDLV